MLCFWYMTINLTVRYKGTSAIIIVLSCVDMHKSLMEKKEEFATSKDTKLSNVALLQMKVDPSLASDHRAAAFRHLQRHWGCWWIYRKDVPAGIAVILQLFLTSFSLSLSLNSFPIFLYSCYKTSINPRPAYFCKLEMLFHSVSLQTQSPQWWKN